MIESYKATLTAPLGFIAPPTFGDGKHCSGTGYLPGEDDPVDVVDLDTPQSQANRLEAALLSIKDEIGLPGLTVGNLHLLQLPHRLGDAILRDSEKDGKAFTLTDEGKKLHEDPFKDATYIFQHAPSALVFGYWLSTTNLGSRAPKVTRSITSHIVGYDTQVMATGGGRLDPLGIEDNVVLYKTNTPGQFWSLEGKDKVSSKNSSGKSGRPSIVNHGNALAQSGKVYTCRHIERNAVISTAPLERLRFDGKPKPEAVAVLRALAQVALAADHEHGYDLRANCQLVAEEGSTMPNLDQAIQALKDAKDACDLKWSSEPLQFDWGQNAVLADKSRKAAQQ